MCSLETVQDKVDYNYRNGLPKYHNLRAHEIEMLRHEEMTIDAIATGGTCDDSYDSAQWRD